MTPDSALGLRDEWKTLRRVRSIVPLPTPGIDDDPLPRARHRHCRGVGRTITSGQAVMLGGLLRQPAGPVGVTPSPMTFGEPSVSIEEVEMRFGSQIGVSAGAYEPDKRFGSRHVDVQPCN